MFLPDTIVQHCRSEWEEAQDYVMLRFWIEQQVLAVDKGAASKID